MKRTNKKKRIRPFILIFAIFFTIANPVLCLQAQEGAEEVAEEKDVHAGGDDALSSDIVPGYDVSPTARDPFFEPSTGQDSGPGLVNGSDLSDAGVLRTAVDRFKVQGVIGESSETGSIILDGKLYRVGEEVDINIGGTLYGITVKNITFNPLGVVFAYKEEASTVRVGNQLEKE